MQYNAVPHLENAEQEVDVETPQSEGFAHRRHAEDDGEECDQDGG